MVVHAGIFPFDGFFELENGIELIKCETVKVKEDDIEKVDSIFDEIKSKANEKLGANEKFGCCCICLTVKYDNNIRKQFIQLGLINGFQKVQIIDPFCSLYLSAVSQSKYSPQQDEMIWIFNDSGDEQCSCTIWQKRHEKVKFIGKSCQSDLAQLISNASTDASTANLKHIIFTSNLCTGFDKNLVDQILKKTCYFDSKFESFQRCALIKAKIMDNIPEFVNFDCETFLLAPILIKMENKDLMVFKDGESLPSVKSLNLNLYECGTKIQVIQNNKSEEFSLPLFDSFMIRVKVDSNTIYSVNFINSSGNEYETQQARPSDAQPTVKILSSYSIPKVQTPFNSGKNAIGIDLGTSRCCVAIIRKNGITTVPLDNTGERLLPSYVSYDEENVKCGQIVVKRLRNYSKSIIFDSKRIIGRSLSDIEIDAYWPFGISDRNSKVCLEVEKFSGKATVIPEEVSAALLKHIKQKAEEFQGKPLSKAVITVPAAFNEAQKNATLEAAEIAGWKEIILLPEPIAAAFAYFNDRSISNNSNVLLFDLGGGTLDVCIFKIQNNQIEIISNTGDSKFGGRDFDTVLINYFKNALSTQYGISFVKHKKYLLMVKCQKIKETLSVMVNASLDVDDFDPTQEGNIEISQEEFQKMCELLLNKVKNTLNAALHNSNFDANEINKVLHVGGGSRMPMIKQLLRNMFPEAEHCIEEHPDEVVAIGAAYYAYSLPSDS